MLVVKAQSKCRNVIIFMEFVKHSDKHAMRCDTRYCLILEEAPRMLSK